MSFIDTESKVKLTYDFAKKRLLMLGFTGSGKSYAGGVMLEEAYRLKLPFIVFDYSSAFLGLAALPHTKYYIVTQTDPAKLGTIISKTNNNCIIPRGQLPENDYFDFCSVFLKNYLARSQKATRLLVVDEAHRFCPLHLKHPIKAQIENVATSGRAEGLILWTMSQRHALLSKTLTNESDNKIIFRLIGHTDLKRIEDILKPYIPNKKELQALIQKTLTYKPGECLVIDVDNSLDVSGDFSDYYFSEKTEEPKVKEKKAVRPAGKKKMKSAPKKRKSKKKEVRKKLEKMSKQELLDFEATIKTNEKVGLIKKKTKRIKINKITHGLSLNKTNRFERINEKWHAIEKGRQDRVEMFAKELRSKKVLSEGIRKPIKVKYLKKNKSYELLDGAHRLAAYCHNNKKMILAEVYV